MGLASAQVPREEGREGWKLLEAAATAAHHSFHLAYVCERDICNFHQVQSWSKEVPPHMHSICLSVCALVGVHKGLTHQVTSTYWAYTLHKV